MLLHLVAAHQDTNVRRCGSCVVNLCIVLEQRLHRLVQSLIVGHAGRVRCVLLSVHVSHISSDFRRNRISRECNPKFLWLAAWEDATRCVRAGTVSGGSRRKLPKGLSGAGSWAFGRLSARGVPPVRPSPVQTVRAPPSRTTQSLDARALIRSEVLVGATIGPPPPDCQFHKKWILYLR
jgi:hypothetical protein